MTHIYRQTKYILQKNCPQMSFPGCRKAPKILLPLLKGPHRLLNWQIQITRVSWVGQSTTNRLFTNRISCLWGVIDNAGQRPKQLLVEFDVLSRNHFCSFQRHPNWSHPILRPAVARVKGQVIFTKVLARAVSKKQGAITAQIRTLPPEYDHQKSCKRWTWSWNDDHLSWWSGTARKKTLFSHWGLP